MSEASKSINGKKGRGCFGCLKGCLGFAGVIILLIIGMSVFSTYKLKQADEHFLENYKPKPEIADIAENDSMTDAAKKLFYKADPEFIGSDKFASFCLVNSVEMALACARSDTPDDPKRRGARIFLFKVDNPEFDIRYTSAAHEMLHLAYRNLKADEKTKLDALIDQELARRQDDTHITEITNIVKNSKSDYQEDLRNEMHSLLGVERLDLLPELENHYKQYLNDRAGLVAINESSGLQKRLKRMSQIKSETEKLDAKLKTLSSQTNAARGNVDEYNSLANKFNTLAATHNQGIEEYNAIFTEVDAFYRLMNPDSKPLSKQSL